MSLNSVLKKGVQNLLDVLIVNIPFRVNKMKRAVVLLPKIKSDHDDLIMLSEILGLQCSVVGKDIGITLCSDTSINKERVELYIYNFTFIIKALRATLEVLFDYDECFYNKFTLKQMFSFFRTYWSELNLSDRHFYNPIKIMKYFTCFPLAIYLDNEPPQKPDGLSNIWLFTGKIKSYLRQRIVSRNKNNTKLWWSFLQGIKRGCHQASDFVVDDSLRKHKDTLMKDHGSNSREFLLDFRKKCSAIAENFEFEFDYNKNHEASHSASYEYKKSDGGSIGFLIDCSDEDGRSDDQTKDLLWYIVAKKINYTLLQMNYSPRLGVKELRGLPHINLKQIRDDIVRGTDDNESLYKATESDEFTPEVPEGEILYYRRPLKATAAAILEPLKVRIITKGETKPYFFAKQMQKSLHSYLKKKSVFSLIGTPLEETHLHGLRQREVDLGIHFDTWVSGDYTASTDAMKKDYIVPAFETFLESSKLDDIEKDIMRSTLYCHEVNYGEKREKFNLQSQDLNPGTNLGKYVMKNGQLMGSILSFPILNVCNLVAYWISIERYLKREIKDYESLPVLTNGDDILFRTNSEHYPIWIECTNEVGFDLSLGKNYTHKNLLTVNSKLFKDKTKDMVEQNIKKKCLSQESDNKNFQKEIYHFSFDEILFHNTGLLYDNACVQDRRPKTIERLGDSLLSSNYNCFIRGSTNKSRAHAQFLHYHKADILKYTDRGRLSLSLPVHLGGLGFEIPENVSRITPGQIRVAKALTQKLLNGSYVQTFGMISDEKSNEVVYLERKFTSLHYGFGPLNDGVVECENLIMKQVNSTRPVQKLLTFKPMKRDEFYDLCSMVWEEEVLDFRKPMFTITIKQQSHIFSSL